MYKNYFYILVVLFSGSIIVQGQSIASDKDTIMTDEILVTANRIKMSALYSPNKIQLINEKQITKLNGDKLSDLLEFSDAIFIKDYGFNSGLKTISINSTQSEHALVLLDGIKLNSPQNAQFDAALLELNNISRVEISNGGSSSLYGSEAIGGVVNIITKSQINNKPFGLNLSNTLGSYGFNKFDITTGNNLKLSGSSAVNLLLSYTNEQAKNDYTYDYFNGFSTIFKNRVNNDYKADILNINADYKIDNTASLKFISIYSKWDRGTPGPDFGYTTSLARQIDNNLISSISYSNTFLKNTHFRTDFVYKYSLMKYYDPLTYNTVSPINSFYKINSFTHTSEINLSKKTSNEITTGYDLNYNSLLSNEVEKSKQLQFGYYAAGKIELNNILEKITFYPSARYDYYSDIHKNVITGKLGINIKPFKKYDLAIKSSLSNSFRSPTFNELFWINGGNKDLLPEKSFNIDAGLIYSFKLIAEQNIEISYFDINTTNRIVWVPENSGLWHPINIGEVKSRGIDLSWKSHFNLSKTLSTAFNVNYNYAKALKKNKDFIGDPTYDKQLINIPQEYSKCSFSLDYNPEIAFLKLISFNIFYNFTGKRFIDFENTAFTPYYDLFDANLSVDLSFFKTITYLKVSVNNITNKNYEVIAGYPMPLRNFKFQIGIKY